VESGTEKEKGGKEKGNGKGKKKGIGKEESADGCSGSTRHTHVPETTSRSIRPPDGLCSSRGDGSGGVPTATSVGSRMVDEGEKERGKKREREGKRTGVRSR
jgi:hypothetical protein